VTELIDRDGVQGILHPPVGEAMGAGVVLTHGAGANCEAPLLAAIADQLAAHGYFVLRCNLAFRQRRRTGPPHPSKSEEDRYSIVQAAAFLRTYAPGRLILSGHSYGGRQVTLAASENKTIADHLLLFSYPLHPPEKPSQLRTAHFPKLKIASTFVHGDKDPFGSPEEMENALKLIPAETKLALVPGAGHDLKRGKFDLLALLKEM
jgi:predicted alpha/beta-hydrolase family hydrolase